MALDYEKDFPSKYVYLPKVGDINLFKIKELRKVETGDPKFHFTVREEVELPDGSTAMAEKNLGFHIEAELEDGKILSISSYSGFTQVFRKHQVNDGDHIKVFHKDRGEWEVKKVNEDTQGDIDEVMEDPDLE